MLRCWYQQDGNILTICLYKTEEGKNSLLINYFLTIILKKHFEGKFNVINSIKVANNSSKN